MALLEVAIDTVRDGMAALEAGADRLEVCSSLDVGGCTPVMEAFEDLRRATRRPLFVMIRSRGGSFVYTQEEKHAMLLSIAEFAARGADGFVIGALDSGLGIDGEFLEAAFLRAADLPCTFHRAFDETVDALGSMQILIDSGITRLLTAGGAQSAEHGIETLRRYVTHAEGRIMILPGGGVRETNVEQILHATEVREIHSSCRNDRGVLDPGLVTLIAGIAHLS